MKAARSASLWALGTAALVAAGVACGPRQIPPGTPPPEYELPVVPPWPPSSADSQPPADDPGLAEVTETSDEAGAEPDAAAPEAAAPAVDSAAPQLSDAGPRR